MKKGKKKSLIITFIGLTLIMVLGFLPCNADTYTTIYADGVIFAIGDLKLDDSNGIRYVTSESSEFRLPYKYSATNTVLNTIPYNEIFTNGIENISVKEIDFRFSVYFDQPINSNRLIKVKMTYRYQPGRASKLNFEQLLNDGTIGIKGNKLSDSATKVLTFDEVNIIKSSINEINQSTYEYDLELELKVPNNSVMYGLEVYCPTVVVNQKLNSSTTNTEPMKFGLQNAEVLLNTTDNINREDVENAQDEADRLDEELNGMTNNMVVETPTPEDLIEQADPFEIIDKDDFDNISNNLQIFIGENPVFIGMTTITFVFVLFKYILFGKG